MPVTPSWRPGTSAERINTKAQGTAPGLLGIRITAVTEQGLEAEMPVDDRHIQPFGILHGGISVVLSETLGSIAALAASPEGCRVVGLEVNANHLAAVPKGNMVTARCEALHLGRTTQVWQTEIRRLDGKLACISRLTVAVLAPEG